ncbi:MAG: tetratricopeptide repeat protein [Akkermansiaceae bacterium]
MSFLINPLPSLFCGASLLFCTLFSTSLAAQDAPELLQNKEYKKAIELLQGDLKDDKLLLLLARAQFLGGQYDDAIKSAEKLTSEFPKSEWIHKAHYIQAQAQNQLRDYKQASAIFEKEAETLFAPQYKDTGAKLLIEVAAKFSYIPKTTELDRSSPDIDKAAKLLNEALTLDCSLGMKETILAELVFLHIKVENWPNSIRYAFQYLDQFDPDWKGTLNSTTRVTSDEKRQVNLVGKNRRAIRFHLAEAYHRNGDRLTATRYLTELIAELKKSNNPAELPILADATWLRLMALREKGGKPRNLQSWIADVKTYLQDYPTHIHSQATAYAIAHSYLSHDEKKNAIIAFQDYIDTFHAKFNETPLTAQPETERQLLSRRNQANSRLENAQYQIGKTYLQLNEFEKAKQSWNLYSQKFPNGAHWAECQKGLVDIDFSIATHAVSLIQTAENKKQAHSKAQQALENFITKHPLDNRIPTAHYLTGNIPYQHAISLVNTLKKTPDDTLKKEQQTSFQESLTKWDTLITKYPRSSHAIQAQYLSAHIYEEHLGNIEKSLDLYAKSSHTNAKSHIQKLKARNIVASSETTYTTTEKPQITLNTRNIEKVTVRQYWLDIESYFRKARKLEDINSLDIDLIEADKTWEVTLPDYKKYHPMETKLDIPFPSNKPGICVIKVESEAFSSTTMVVRSDVDIAVRSNKEEVITYVHNARQDSKPAKNTQVIIADGGKVITIGTTNDQGIFHYRDASLAEVNDLRVLALSDQGAATCALNLASLNLASLTPSKKRIPSVRFNLAKPTYLPGETVAIGGIIRFPSKESANNASSVYVSPNNNQREFTLTIKETGSKKLVHQSKITTTPTGIFQHSYKLPSYLTNANLVIQLKPNFDDTLPTFSHYLSVDQYADDLVSIKLEMDKKWTTEDNLVTGKISANYRWGAPYSDRKLTVQLPNDQSINVKTDTKGEASFRYDAQYIEAGNVIQFFVSTQDQEYYSNTTTVLIDPINFSILASTDFASAAAGSEVTLTAKTILPDETPVSRELKLEVFQINRIKPNPILLTCKDLEHLSKSITQEKIIQTIPLTTNPETGKTQHILTFDKSGNYLIRVTSTDSKGRTVIANSSISIHDESSNKKLILFTDKRDLNVGKSATINAYSYFKSPTKALLTVETDKIIEKRIIDLNPGKNDIPLPLTTAHAPAARVNLILINERKFYSASDILPVQNKITLKVTTDKIDIEDPFKKFDYKAKIQAFDANNQPVSADYFINLTHRSNYTPIHYVNLQQLANYQMNSNCGLIHKGRQEVILTEIRDELLRMEQEQSLSSHRPNIPNNLRGANDSNRSIRPSPLQSQSEEIGTNFLLPGHNNDELNNPNREFNYNGNNFFGNQNTLAQHTQKRQYPELPNSIAINGGLATSHSNFPVTPATPVYLLENTINTTAYSNALTIPKEGTEILLTKELIYGDLDLHIYAFDQGSGFGMHHQELETNLKNLTPSPRSDLAGSPITSKSSQSTNIGDNQITLTLPNGIQPTALKLTTSANSTAFLNDIISSPLITNFGSDTPFHEAHPAGQLMAVCSYLEYLIAHNHDAPAQQQLRKTASRLCADLTLSQKTNGSWSQVRNRKASSLIHTTLAYRALMMANTLEIPHEKLTSRNALQWITTQQKSITTDHYNSRALVQLALASSGDADFATCNRLYRERNKMDNIGRAILANVFVLLDRKDFTITLLKEITYDIEIKHPSEAFLRSSVLLNSLKLKATKATNQVIANPNFTHHFRSDIERGYAANAYSELFLQELLLQEPATLTISVNGQKLENLTVPANLLKAGDNIIQINSSRPGAVISAELIGRQPLKPSSPLKDYQIEDRKYYQERLSYKGQPLKTRGTSPLTQASVGELVHVHLKGVINNKSYPDSIIIEEIPAGFTYLSGSLSGNHSGARQQGNHLIITYGSLPNKFNLRYTLIAEHTGKWTHNPSILSASYDTTKTSSNSTTTLTVIPKRAPNNLNYQTNQAEHYELAQLHFKAKEYQQAKQHIIAYRKLKQDNEDPLLSQMLLWIETDQAKPDAQLLAESFEVLTERNPDLVIPFDKILKVGKAYRQLNEFERSMDVYTATLDAGYSADSYVGAALEDQGKFMLSVDYQNKLWLLYPDLGEISTSRFALAQQIYSKAPNAKSLGENPDTKKPFTEKELIELSLQHTSDFLTHTPEHELADDATFSLANALFALKRYDDVIKLTAKAITTYKDSEHATSFRYMQALGHFWLRNYDQALKSASEVAKGKSKDKDLAAFITAQIYHAKGLPQKAIEWYKGIETAYPDAKESIAYFEQKSITLDEVKVLNSGEQFTFQLKYRNIKEAQFQVYRVDLMKLFLREKNLSNISEINLAGITPKYNSIVQLGDGNDYQEREKEISLPINDDGAYLVICRGDYLHTTGLVLITPLKLEVQESPEDQSVRVNISDKKSGKYIDSVHVKAIGTGQDRFKSGETDLRGVWQTAHITSPSTIIAKDPKGRYAFFRSKLTYVPTDAADDPFGGADQLNNVRKPSKKIDFNSNLKLKQEMLDKSNLLDYENNRRSNGKGVEIKKVRKK